MSRIGPSFHWRVSLTLGYHQVCYKFPFLSPCQATALIWQNGVQRGQREIAYLCVFVCHLYLMIQVTPSKAPQHGGCWFFNAANFWLHLNSTTWPHMVTMIHSQSTFEKIQGQCQSSYYACHFPQNTLFKKKKIMNPLLPYRNNTNWEKKQNFIYIYIVTPSQMSQTMRDFISVGFAGLLFILTEGLKSHRI